MRRKPIEEILKPYIKQVTERDNLPIDQTALVIMDVFKGQVTPIVLDLYKESNIVVVLVPANMKERKGVTRYRCSSSFINFKAFSCRMVSRLL